MHGFASVAAKLGYNKTMASNGPANDSNSSTSDEISYVFALVSPTILSDADSCQQLENISVIYEHRNL